MSLYYVRTSGSDLNDGTTPATAWRTIGKALGTSGISSGDTVHIGGGLYREIITVAMVDPTSETFVIGDTFGAETGDAGEVRITNYLTDDKSGPTDQSLVTLNGRSHLTFQGITFFAAYSASSVESHLINATADASTYISFEKCTFFLFDQSYTGCVIAAWYSSAINDLVLHWLIDRCLILSDPSDAGIWCRFSGDYTANTDIDFVVQNCLVYSIWLYSVVFFQGDPLRSIFPGGGKIINCTCLGDSKICTTIYWNNVVPASVTNSLVITAEGNYSLGTNVAGSLVEDYNLLFGTSTPRPASISPGAHTITGIQYAPLFHWGQEFQLGALGRPLGTPTVGSPLLGFGDSGDAPTFDVLSRPRPAGGQSTLKAVGAYERHDTGIEDTSIYDSAPASVKIIGPGDQDFELPVNPVSTNVTVMGYYNAAHSSGSPPQAQLLANPLIGLSSGSTLTMTEPEDTWEQLAFPTFVPTDYGVVTLRCISRSSSGSGAAWFDSITV